MAEENSISVEELAEQNIDWYAAACIYIDESTVLPLDGQKRGFRGIVRLSIDVSNIAFCRKTSQDGHYRYFTIDNHPILTVALDYVYNNDLESDTHDDVYDE